MSGRSSGRGIGLDENTILYEADFIEVKGDSTASTYTAVCTVPAGYSVTEMRFQNSVVWDAGTSANLVIGDADDVDGYYASTSVKTTPAVTAGSINGWGVDLITMAGDWLYGKYYPTGGTVTATITVHDDGTHHAGRSRWMVIMQRGDLYDVAAHVV